jgi:site-specific DNA recombinase
MTFWAAIRNPCYCGKIILPKMGNEEELVVKGIHEPLISESLFNDVQDVLEGRKKNQFIKQATPKQLPLRSFMICPECNRILTGSASKARSEYYYYYHCKRPCRIRFKADEVNDYFDAVLRQFVPKTGMAALYRDVVCDTFNNSNGAIQEERKNFIQQITDQNNRVTKPRELLLKDFIDGDEYRNLKVEAEKTIGKLEAKLKDLNEKIAYDLDIFGILHKAIENLKNIAQLYKNSDMEGKQFIIGSIFPKKFVFDGEIDRTAPMNLAFHPIYQINNKLQNKKKP